MSREYFASTEETRKVFLEEPDQAGKGGVYVVLRERLPWGYRKRMDGAAVTSMSTEQLRAGADGKDIEGAERSDVMGTTTYGLNLYVPAFLKLSCYVVAWNLPGPDGKPVRLPRQLDEKARLMETLDEDIGEEIAAKIDAMVAERQKMLAAAKDADESAGSIEGTVIEGTSERLDPNPTPARARGTPTSAALSRS